MRCVSMNFDTFLRIQRAVVEFIVEQAKDLLIVVSNSMTYLVGGITLHSIGGQLYFVC